MRQRRTSHPYSPLTKPLGILGGGQLARMMVLKAHELGVPAAVLSEHPDDPAAQVTSLWFQGRSGDQKSLVRFLKSCSVVTFESEFMDAERLESLRISTKTPVFPRPKHMGLVQDRLSQKQLLEKHGLPTSPFLRVHTADQAHVAYSRWGGNVVFKKRRFGYDGYGTFIVRSRKDLNEFLPELASNEFGFIAEAFVPFQRELAIMVARGSKGSPISFPFVETFQQNSRCLWVKGPLAPTPKLRKLERSLKDLLSDLGYIGILGVELFDTGHDILINELAPRVHNSGHYSLDALSTDQFSIHIKALLGQPLTSPQPLAPGFAMLNLLGETARTPSWTLPPDIHFHWYGKKENRRGRKMGHINAVGTSPEKALRLVRLRRKNFKL